MGRLGGGSEAGEEGLNGKMAGDFAGCRPSDAIANDERSALGQCGAGVLIDVAHPARIREHGEVANG